MTVIRFKLWWEFILVVTAVGAEGTLRSCVYFYHYYFTFRFTRKQFGVTDRLTLKRALQVNICGAVIWGYLPGYLRATFYCQRPKRIPERSRGFDGEVWVR